MTCQEPKPLTGKQTYYLIDYENVNEIGLAGAENLLQGDHVHLFTSKNALKINIEMLVNFNSTQLLCHIVPANKQSVDMNIASYLGYLIAKTDPAKSEYVIISKDTGYDNVISFWASQLNIFISRRDSIKASEANKIPVTEIIKKLEAESLDSDIIKFVCNLVMNHRTEKNGKQTIYLSIVKKYGQQNGQKVYNYIKKLI